MPIVAFAMHDSNENAIVEALYQVLFIFSPLSKSIDSFCLCCKHGSLSSGNQDNDFFVCCWDAVLLVCFRAM